MVFVPTSLNLLGLWST